jgi:hypothetical protein
MASFCLLCTCIQNDQAESGCYCQHKLFFHLEWDVKLIGSVADPWHFGVDPDPANFIIDLQDANKNKFFKTIFSAYYFLKVHLHHFSKIKSQKQSLNSRNQGFPYYFCMMIEGSGSGSIPLTNGSGSGRPKNMCIRWIRIRNTAYRFFKSWF